MIRRGLVPVALAFLFATLPARATQPGIPVVTILEPTGFVILTKPEDSIRFRWQVPMPIAKSLWPGMSFWAAPRVSVEGKTVDLKQQYLTPAVPESGIVEVVVSYWEILRAGKEVGFAFDKPCKISWKVDIRPKDQGGNLMTGQGAFVADLQGRSALTISDGTWGGPHWPALFQIRNGQYWSSKPTTLKVTVKRLDEDQEVVRQHCPVRIADFEAPVPKILYEPFTVEPKKPAVNLSPVVKGKLAAGGTLAKAVPIGGPGPTPTPPVVQQVVNCRFVVTAVLPRADNPEDKNMTPAGIRREFPVQITVPLK